MGMYRLDLKVTDAKVPPGGSDHILKSHTRRDVLDFLAAGMYGWKNYTVVVGEHYIWCWGLKDHLTIWIDLDSFKDGGV